MEQAKALNALEPFLALSRSATSPRAAADLISRATSAPNTFIFTELLQTPQIQALASSDEFASHLTVLKIFSYGTYSSYTSTAGLPELNDAQRLKLRQLSLLTLAKKDQDSKAGDAGSPALGYTSLQNSLGLESRQALEELVISAVYAGLIKAQLNPKASLVQINSVSPLRDVAPTSISSLLSSLHAWAGRCESTLESLSCQMTQLRADADRRAARSAARASDLDLLIKRETSGGKPPKFISSSTKTRATTAVAVENIATFRDSRHKGSAQPSSGAGVPNTTTTTTDNEMNSVLTVGGGSSILTPGELDPGTASPDGGSTPLSEVRSAVKRSSEDMTADDKGVERLNQESSSVGETVDGATDGPEPPASKRKLEG